MLPAYVAMRNVFGNVQSADAPRESLTVSYPQVITKKCQSDLLLVISIVFVILNLFYFPESVVIFFARVVACKITDV